MTLQRISITVKADDGSLLIVDTAGATVPAVPGLLITPWHDHGRIVVGRFTLTHHQGRALVPFAWCQHEARRWADAAGWVGVDWRAPAADLMASKVARTFACRLMGEWRICDRCPALPGDVEFKLLRRSFLE